MIQLKTTDLQGLVKDLKTVSELAKQIDGKLTGEIHDMSSQLEADNYGTNNSTKKPLLSNLIKKMDVPDKLSETCEALIGGIEAVIKNK